MFGLKWTRPALLASCMLLLVTVPVARAAPAHAAEKAAFNHSGPTASTAAVTCPSWAPPIGSWHGPYWWGAVDASNKVGSRKVLDIQGPWFGNGVEVHIWDWLNWTNQYWCMGYAYTDQNSGHNAYELVNAYTWQCLTASGIGNGVQVLQYDCDGGSHQLWLQVPMGTVSIANQGSPSTYAFANGWAGGCLDVRDFGTANGSILQIWTCSGSLNQRWF